MKIYKILYVCIGALVGFFGSISAMQARQVNGWQKEVMNVNDGFTMQSFHDGSVEVIQQGKKTMLRPRTPVKDKNIVFTHDSPLMYVSPDKNFVGLIGSDGIFRIWNIKKQKCIQERPIDDLFNPQLYDDEAYANLEKYTSIKITNITCTNSFIEATIVTKGGRWGSGSSLFRVTIADDHYTEKIITAKCAGVFVSLLLAYLAYRSKSKVVRDIFGIGVLFGLYNSLYDYLPERCQTTKCKLILGSCVLSYLSYRSQGVILRGVFGLGALAALYNVPHVS